MTAKKWAEKAHKITGPAGQLDLRVGEYTEASAEKLKCGFIMCHPHPLFSGTMDNKVVTTLVRGAAQLGLDTLRFNFRGVGESKGEHSAISQTKNSINSGISKKAKKRAFSPKLKKNLLINLPGAIGHQVNPTND